MGEVDKLINKLDPKRKEIVQKLRKIVKKALLKAVEVAKWRKPIYEISDKKVAWILIYPGYVDLGFFKGARLKSQLLEGTGKGLRHIKIRTEEDIAEVEFGKLLKEAAKLV